MTKIAAVILSGGKSTRMGQDKATVSFKGKTLLAHCQTVLDSTSADKIFISSKSGIPDQIENLGPIGGIISSLIRLNQYELVLFTPIDMPLMTAKIYNHLINQPLKTMSYFKRHYMPFLIRNNSEIRNEINLLIASKQLAIHQLIKKLDASEIEFDANDGIDERLFINVNDSEQLAKINH